MNDLSRDSTVNTLLLLLLLLILLLWCLEANKATETHCDNPGMPTYPFGHIVSMDDSVDAKRILLASPEGTGEDTPHHMAKHHPARSETSQSHTPWSSRYGSESPSVEVAVDVRRYAILELHARSDDDDDEYLLIINERETRQESTLSVTMRRQDADSVDTLRSRECAAQTQEQRELRTRGQACHVCVTWTTPPTPAHIQTDIVSSLAFQAPTINVVVMGAA